MFWSWFRQVGNDTPDIHIYLSFTWQVLLLNYLSEQSMQWWGSNNGTRTRSLQTRPPPPDIIPLDIIPRATSPGQPPPMDNIARTFSPHGQYLCLSFNRQSSNKYSKRSIATQLDFKSYIMENIHTTQVDLHMGGGEVDLQRGGGFT